MLDAAVAKHFDRGCRCTFTRYGGPEKPWEREQHEECPVHRREQVLPAVMEDLLARERQGIETYGEPLSTFNGRSALQDAYEEALDLAMYLKQALLEQEARDA